MQTLRNFTNALCMYHRVTNVTNVTNASLFRCESSSNRKRDELSEMRLNETLTSVVKLQFTKIRRINV